VACPSSWNQKLPPSIAIIVGAPHGPEHSLPVRQVHHTSTIVTSKNDGEFGNGRQDNNAFRFVEQLLRNVVGHIQDFLHHQFRLPSEVTPSFSQHSGAASNTLASASVNAFDRSAGALIHRLPRSSIFNHKAVFDTAEKNKVAGDPTSQSNRGNAVRSGSWVLTKHEIELRVGH